WFFVPSRRRHTRFSRDWSSDVCSSDLVGVNQYESGDYLRDVSHIYCSFTRVRDIFDIMPRDTAEQWANIASRLEKIGEPFEGWQIGRASCRESGWLEDGGGAAYKKEKR